MTQAEQGAYDQGLEEAAVYVMRVSPSCICVDSVIKGIRALKREGK